MKTIARIWKGNRLRQPSARQSGAALVEFGLIAVVFFTIVTLFIQGGFLFGSWLVVTNAAREASRFAALCISRAEMNPPAYCGTGDWSTQPNAVNTIVEYTKSYIAWPDPNDPAWNVIPSVTWDGVSQNPRLVRVRVTYGVPLIVPLLGAVIDDPLPLVAESDMRIE